MRIVARPIDESGDPLGPWVRLEDAPDWVLHAINCEIKDGLRSGVVDVSGGFWEWGQESPARPVGAVEPDDSPIPPTRNQVRECCAVVAEIAGDRELAAAIRAL